jgi:dienelactone hydrolase
VFRPKKDGSGANDTAYSKSSENDGDTTSSSNDDTINKMPGIILFHTGAGPQDLFLRWKADSLVNDKETFGANGAVVFIADILGDGMGWAWDTDRSRYAKVRSAVLVPNENGERPNLKARIQAALDCVVSQPGVDRDRIGAIGFCLGGHPILELGRMKNESVKCMVTFHGVFDGVTEMHLEEANERQADEGDADNSNTDATSQCNVLICTGNDDPFVKPTDLDAATDMFERLGYNTTVVRYDNTKHGFTNPAQAHNTNPSFGYNEEVSGLAWDEMRRMLKESLAR